MRWQLVAGWLSLWVASSAPGADPSISTEALSRAEKSFQEIYGAERTRVSASKKGADKVAFAQKLWAAAKIAKDDPALVKVLSDKAVEFAASDAAGLRLALEIRRSQAAAPPAPEHLAELAELLEKILKADKLADRPATARELVAVHRALAKARSAGGDQSAAAAELGMAKGLCRTHLRGNEVRDTLREIEGEEKEVERERKLAADIDRLRAILKKAPADPKANLELAFVFLYDGKPREAASHLSLCEPEPLRRLGGLLAKDPPAPDSELGNAYRAALEALPAEKELLSASARTHYEAALEKNPAHPDAARIRLILSELPKPASGPPEIKGTFDKTRVAVLFEDEKGFAEMLGKLAAAAQKGEAMIEERDRYSGNISLRVKGMRHVNNVPNWKFEIVEKPTRPGQFRFIRFACKSLGQEKPWLGFAVNGEFVSKGYALAANHPWKGVMLFDVPPKEWKLVTRDLYADFGAITLTGVDFSFGDMLYDHIYLGRSLDDFRNLPRSVR